jgi:hypothetical protein
MASFSFTKHGSSDPTVLDKIDELMVEDLNKLGEKVIILDPERVSYLYSWTVEVGFAVLSFGGSWVTEPAYKKWKEKSAKLNDNENFRKIEPLIKKYLYGDYHFTAWR